MKVSVFGGDKKFIKLLDKLCELKVSECVSDAIEYATGEADTLFILPRYDAGEYSIPEFSDKVSDKLFELIKGGRVKVYIENYPAYDYRDCFVLGLQARSMISSMGKLSVCLFGSYSASLGFEILQKRRGYYYPNAVHTDDKYEILAEVKNCLGVHRVIASLEREGVALLKTSRGVYCSMVDLTHLNDNEIFSYSHWRDFYAVLLGELIGADGKAIKEAFNGTYTGIGIKKGTRATERREALLDAVRAAVDWHGKSGITDTEGMTGVYEMIRSFDLGVSRNLRGDSAMFTAALYMASGKYFGKAEHIKIADSLASSMLEKNGLQIREGENNGLFKWFSGSSGMGAKSVYVSDSSRVGNSVYALFRMSGDEKYRKAAVDLGDALLRWFGCEALLPGCQLNYEKDDLISVQTRKRPACPEFYDAPLIFLGNLYSMTGDERYRDQIIKTATLLAKRYPDYDTVTSHSDNFTLSRLLGALSVAQRFGDGVWTRVIDKLLLYFKDRRHKSGGFSDGKAYFDKNSLGKDMEFAVGFGAGDAVADLVYCQNTLAYSLNILLSAEGGYNRSLAEDMQNGLIEFLLDTQIRSKDERFDGAWMRAFDMDNMEYYGCDKDFAWGPYCILTGWVTGAIPLVFLDILGFKTMY